MFNKLAGVWARAKRALGIGINSTPVSRGRRPRITETMAHHDARHEPMGRRVTLFDMMAAGRERSVASGAQNAVQAGAFSRLRNDQHRQAGLPGGVAFPASIRGGIADSQPSQVVKFDGIGR